MTENMANMTYRGYNVPHSTAVWLGMYRVARFYDGLTTAFNWAWYLERAFKLVFKLGTPDVGLMDGESKDLSFKRQCCDQPAAITSTVSSGRCDNAIPPIMQFCFCIISMACRHRVPRAS